MLHKLEVDDDGGDAEKLTYCDLLSYWPQWVHPTLRFHIHYAVSFVIVLVVALLLYAADAYDENAADVAATGAVVDDEYQNLCLKRMVHYSMARDVSDGIQKGCRYAAVLSCWAAQNVYDNHDDGRLAVVNDHVDNIQHLMHLLVYASLQSRKQFP